MGKQAIVLLLAAINFTHIMDVMIMMPLSDIFLEDFGIQAAEFSYLISAYAIGAFISSMVGVFILDRFGRKRALLFVYAGFTIGTLLCGFAWNYTALLIMRLITGMFGGIIGALALSIISDLYSFEERGKAIGILMAAFSAASALGVPAGLYFAAIYTWSLPFYFVGGLGAILLIMAYFILPVMDEHLTDDIPTPLDTVKSITGDINQLNALALGIILVIGHFIIIPFITPYMTRNVGFEQYQISYIYLIGGILTIFSGPVIGQLTDRFGALRTFYVVVVLSFIPVILITHIGNVPIYIALIITSLFFVLGSGRMIAPNTMITAAVGPNNRGSFMSVKSAFQQLAIAFASFVSGLIVYIDDSGTMTNYQYVGYLSVLFCILAMFIAPRLKVVKGN
jgi:predicted MFS family arabinose efflux permease